VRTLLVCAVLFAVPAVPAAAGAAWRPDTRAAIAYARERRGEIGFAVRTPTRAWGWHAGRAFPSASVLKAMLLVAYLRRGDVAHRRLRASETALLRPMIERSDNVAATRMVQIVGTGGLARLARAVGMRSFRPVYSPWGDSLVNARDQSRFFLHIDADVPRAHRAYAMHLLRSITPSQRWGIGRVRPRGWSLFFKGGWGSGTGRVDHQVALLTRGRRRVSVAIMTEADGTHAYGKETLRGIALRLLRGL
jgi:Beta-lactamase enzyme family